MLTIKNTSVSTRCKTDICNSGLQNDNVVAYYNLFNRENCPELKIIPKLQRGLSDTSKMSYKDLERSILTFGYAYQPILVSADGYILDGQHRWKIVENLWEKGINVGISIVKTPLVKSTDNNIRNVIIDLQKGHAWTPEDKLKSLAATGNETAKLILKLANNPLDITKKKKFGARNAFVLMGMNPDNFDVIPEDVSQETVETANRLFEEVNTLLTIGKKEYEKANNWTEAFVKAWRRIRLNDPSLKKENEEGEKTIVDTQALNNMIDSIGLVKLGVKWRAYADKALASGRIGRWVEVFERAIVQTYEYIQAYENEI